MRESLETAPVPEIVAAVPCEVNVPPTPSPAGLIRSVARWMRSLIEWLLGLRPYLYFMRFSVLIWVSMPLLWGLDCTGASVVLRGILALSNGWQLVLASFFV